MPGKILIIDREPDNRRALDGLLKRHGFAVESISPRDDAMPLIRTGGFGLVLMDVNLPGVDSYRLIREMKESDKDLRIIILTGQNSVDHAVRALRSGVFDFLSKPLHDENQLMDAVHRAMESSERSAASGKRKILVVEDELQFQEMLVKMLSVAPVEITVASNGFEAGCQVSTLQPDLILLDIMLPGLDGFKVCEQIKSNLHTSRIKVIAMTGYDTEEHRARILKTGADGYLTKPFSRDELFRAVNITVENKQHRDKASSTDDLLMDYNQQRRDSYGQTG